VARHGHRATCGCRLIASLCNGKDDAV
jgi:uncharacterized Zn-binding protein involved in type VI secretion